jgi:hypothetical protein
LLERRVLTLASVVASVKHHNRIYILQVCDEKKTSFSGNKNKNITDFTSVKYFTEEGLVDT